MTFEKIKVIRDYLIRHFPSAIHDYEHDADTCGHKFRIETKDQVLLTSLSKETVEECNTPKIIERLNTINIIDLLKKNPGSIVVVKGNVIKIEPKN